MFKGYRGLVLLMLFLASVINYIDRAALSIAAPMLSKELHLNSAQLGIIFSSFFIGYALFNFVGGYMSDKKGPVLIFGIFMTIWSLFGGLTGVAFSFASLFVIRVIFGMGEGPNSAVTNKMINNWFPAKERARAVAIAIAGLPFGAALAGPIIGLLAVQFGWRVPFFVLMVLGLIWAVIWMKSFKDRPRDQKNISAQEVQLIEHGQETATTMSSKLPLSYFLKHPVFLSVAMAFFAMNYILYFLLTWFPSYLVDARHLSVKSMSIVTVIPWLIGLIGQVSGGFISDYIYSKTNKLLFSRKIVIVTSLVLSAIGVALCGIATTTTMAVTLMALGAFFMYIPNANIWAIIQDIVPKDKVGGTGGFVHFVSNISGIIGPSVTGFIVLTTGHYTSAFLLTGILAVLGAAAVAFVVRENRQEKLQQESNYSG